MFKQNSYENCYERVIRSLGGKLIKVFELVSVFLMHEMCFKKKKKNEGLSSGLKSWNRDNFDSSLFSPTSCGFGADAF